MAFKLRDKVRETFTTTSTGAITPAGVVPGEGNQSISSVLSASDTSIFVARKGSQCQVFIGTWNGTTVARTTTLYSTSGGSDVDFAAGTGEIFIDIAAVFLEILRFTAYDGVNDKVSISRALTVSKNAAAPPALSTAVLHVQQVDGSNNTFVLDAYGNSRNRVLGRRAANTAASPSAVADHQTMLELSCLPYGASGYAGTVSAAIALITDGIQSDANHGSLISFQVTPNGSTSASLAEVGRVKSDGTWQLNNYNAGFLQSDSDGNLSSLALAQAQAALGVGVVLVGYAKGVDLNSVADTPITIVSPTANYRLQSILIVNTGATASLTTAQYGIFSASGGGGTALVASGTALSAITSNTVNDAANTLQVAVTRWLNLATLYFRVTQAQGAPASADVYVYGFPLP